LPGGTIDDIDRTAGDDELALQACAHRELFEETGLLRHQLPATRTSGDALGALREQLLALERTDTTPPPPSPWPSVIAGSVPPLPMRDHRRRRRRGDRLRVRDRFPTQVGAASLSILVTKHC
jgi:8-oxo-dGTP pyrophosphatase MutT (NUDIX family)